jgi:PAS domain S-box-containing protein
VSRYPIWLNWLNRPVGCAMRTIERGRVRMTHPTLARMNLAASLASLLAAWLGLMSPVCANQTLTLGMMAYRPQSLLEAQWQPLVDYLGQALPGHTVRLRVMQQAELERALRQKELDFIFTNPNHFISLRESNALSGAIATLVSLEGGTPSAQLGGVIIRLSERDDLKTLSDLAGQRIAAVGINYLGGHLAQMAEILSAEIDPASLDMLFTGQPHDRVFEAVLSGQADAGFVRTGVIEQKIREGSLDASRLRVVRQLYQPGFPYLVSTGLYPEWPVVALPGVDPHVTRRVAAALLALEPEHPVSQAVGIHGFTVPADYSIVDRSMRLLRLPPFDQAPRFTWRDVWSRFQATLVVLLLAMAGMAMLAYRLMLNNRNLAAARSERARAAEQLERQRGQLQTLIETVPDLIWTKNAEGVYLNCNPRFERFFGAREADIVGKTDYDFVDREQADSFRAHDRKVMRNGGPSRNEEWVTFADDGHRELVETTKTPMFDAQGNLIGVLGIAHDITERTRMEQALAMREQYQRALIDNFPFMVWLKDADSRYLAVNRPFAEMCGVDSPQALVGKSDFDLWSADLAERYQADDRAVLASGQPKVVEELVEINGQRNWVETYKSPVMMDGKSIGTVGFARDISAQKRAEDLQRYSAFQAGIAEMSVSVLHNIGNAITSVLENAGGVRQASQDLTRVSDLLRENGVSFAVRLADDGLNASQSERLLAIQRQAALAIDDLNQRELARRSQRILDSVEHISEIVRIQQSAALPMATASAFDLGSLVHDALAMLEDSFSQQVIQVEKQIDAGVGMLLLSRNRLLQALINVLKNAYESIGQRQVDAPDLVGRIQIRAMPIDVNRFRLEVEDNGAGFSPEQQPRLFEFGFSTKTRGSGFGLHATGLFVQELGGTIQLESAGCGQGACLRLELPRGGPGNSADAGGRHRPMGGK